jgi:hypothetical protein
MKTDPFAFLRGAAAVMAVGLASAPATDLDVRSGGIYEIAAALSRLFADGTVRPHRRASSC